MDKFKIDYNEVVKQLQPDQPIPLEKVANKIEKVAFNVVRYNDGNKTSLWEVKDGHLVALYDEEVLEKQSWSVEPDKTGKYATVFYKDTAITNIKYADYKIESSEINNFTNLLPQRLANNTELVKKMLNSLDSNYKAKILETYPELV